MNLKYVLVLALAASLLSGCTDSVPLSYSTKAEAEVDRPFARGWLPDIIPASSKNISMTNDLDLNLSKGEFNFDPADHETFVKHLTKSPTDDKDGYSAYVYGDWLFRISTQRNNCLFGMETTTKKQPNE